jgi:hypothetical protein
MKCIKNPIFNTLIIAIFTGLFVWFGLSMSIDLSLSTKDIERASNSDDITLIGNIKTIIKNGGERYKTRIVTEDDVVVDVGMDYDIAKLFNTLSLSNIDIETDTNSNIYCLTYYENKKCTFGLPAKIKLDN